VDAVPVEGDGGVAEQHHRVRREGPGQRRRRAYRLWRRLGGFWRAGCSAIDHILLFDHRRRCGVPFKNRVPQRGDGKPAGPPLLLLERHHLADPAYLRANPQRSFELGAPAAQHPPRQIGGRGQQSGRSGMAVLPQPGLRRHRREQDHVPPLRQGVAVAQARRILIKQGGKALHQRQRADIGGFLPPVEPVHHVVHSSKLPSRRFVSQCIIE
jgi:hypothetical protein